MRRYLSDAQETPEARVVAATDGGDTVWKGSRAWHRFHGQSAASKAAVCPLFMSTKNLAEEARKDHDTVQTRGMGVSHPEPRMLHSPFKPTSDHLKLATYAEEVMKTFPVVKRTPRIKRKRR